MPKPKKTPAASFASRKHRPRYDATEDIERGDSPKFSEFEGHRRYSSTWGGGWIRGHNPSYSGPRACVRFPGFPLPCSPVPRFPTAPRLRRTQSDARRSPISMAEVVGSGSDARALETEIQPVPDVAGSTNRVLTTPAETISSCWTCSLISTLQKTTQAMAATVRITPRRRRDPPRLSSVRVRH